MHAVSYINHQGPGPIALVGSGEFLPQMIAVDEWLLADRIPRAAFLPTAAGQEGDASIQHWLRLADSHYAGMGIEPVPVPVLNRDDANNPELAALIANVGLVYLSGGNPGYVAETLRGTLVWDAIVAAWQAGAALAGCSAGAMALTMEAPTRRGQDMVPTSGLALLDHLAVIPHFDQMASWNPGFLDRARQPRPHGITVIGVDEDTAVVGGPSNWTVMGRLGATVFGPEGEAFHPAGSTFTLAPTPR